MRCSLFIILFLVMAAGVHAQPGLPGFGCSNVTELGFADFEPQAPNDCDELDLYYFTVCQDPSIASTVTARVTFDGFATTTSVTLVFNENDQYWLGAIQIPRGATNFLFFVEDDAGGLDDNFGDYYGSAVSVCPAVQIDPQFPNANFDDLMIIFNPADGPLSSSTQMFAAIEFQPFASSNYPMAFNSANETWTLTTDIPDTSTNAVFFFTDGTTDDTNQYSVAISTNTFTIRGDLDGDARGDLFFANGDQVGAIVFMNGNTFGSSGFLNGEAETFAPWTIGAFSDLDGDFKDDIIAGYKNEGIYVLATMDGPNIDTLDYMFGEEESIDPWQVVAGGDYNADAKGDLVYRDRSSGRHLIAYMNDASITNLAFILDGVPFGDWKGIGGGDLDGDGIADLIVRFGSSGYYAVILAPGSDDEAFEFLSGAAIDISPWEVAGISDIDGNGISELILRLEGTSAHQVQYMDGAAFDDREDLFGFPAVIRGWRVIAPR